MVDTAAVDPPLHLPQPPQSAQQHSQRAPPQQPLFQKQCHKPRVHLVGNRALVWSIEDAKVLRKTYRIVGTPIGTLPRNATQNLFMGLPLVLLPEELTILLEKGIVELVDEQQAYRTPTELEKSQWSQPATGTTVTSTKSESSSIVTGSLSNTPKKPNNNKQAKSNLGSIIIHTLSNHLPWYRFYGEQKNSVKTHQTQAADSGALNVTLQEQTVGSQTELSQQQQIQQGLTSLWRYPRTTHDRLKLSMYRHLWEPHILTNKDDDDDSNIKSRGGYFMAPGMKYGGDYLLYPQDPALCHASLVASAKDMNQRLDLNELASLARLATTVSKLHLLFGMSKGKKEAKLVGMETEEIDEMEEKGTEKTGNGNKMIKATIHAANNIKDNVDDVADDNVNPSMTNLHRRQNDPALSSLCQNITLPNNNDESDHGCQCNHDGQTSNTALSLNNVKEHQLDYYNESSMVSDLDASLKVGRFPKVTGSHPQSQRSLLLAAQLSGSSEASLLAEDENQIGHTPKGIETSVVDDNTKKIGNSSGRCEKIADELDVQSKKSDELKAFDTAEEISSQRTEDKFELDKRNSAEEACEAKGTSEHAQMNDNRTDIMGDLGEGGIRVETESCRQHVHKWRSSGANAAKTLLLSNRTNLSCQLHAHNNNNDDHNANADEHGQQQQQYQERVHSDHNAADPQENSTDGNRVFGCMKSTLDSSFTSPLQNHVTTELKSAMDETQKKSTREQIVSLIPSISESASKSELKSTVVAGASVEAKDWVQRRNTSFDNDNNRSTPTVFHLFTIEWAGF